MLRKLILLALTSAIAKMVYDKQRRKQLTPFPTSSRPPQGRMRRA
jgi:hypothetical protein